MTNATKTLGIIFAISTVLLAIDYGFDTSGRSEIFTGKLVEADTAEVNRLVLTNPAEGNHTELFKETGNWQVRASERTYQADQNAVQTALAALHDMNIKALVTRDPAKYTRYRVDSTGTEITLYNNKNELGGLIVGAPQFVSQREQNTYVRRKGEEEVIAVEGFLTPQFSAAVDNWRDKTIWTEDKESIIQVDFNFPADSSFSMRRVENGWISGTDTLKQSQVSRVLNTLSTLRATGFTGEEGQLEEPLYRIDVKLSKGVTNTLRIKPMDGDGNRYQLSASDYPYIFTVPKGSWDRGVLAGRKAFLQEQD